MGLLLLGLLLTFCLRIDPLNAIHGGVILGLTGKDSVTLSVDSRFSSHQTGSLLLGEQPRGVFRVGTRTMVACVGLESDIALLMHELRGALRHTVEDDLEPAAVARVLSDILYTKKYMCTPVVAGVGTHGMDGLGAQTVSTEFVAVGSSSAALLSACESIFKPNRRASVVLEFARDIVQRSLQRDVLSGCRVFSYTCQNQKFYKTESAVLPDV